MSQNETVAEAWAEANAFHGARVKYGSPTAMIDDAKRRYQNDATFHALVKALSQAMREDGLCL